MKNLALILLTVLSASFASHYVLVSPAEKATTRTYCNAESANSIPPMFTSKVAFNLQDMGLAIKGPNGHYTLKCGMPLVSEKEDSIIQAYCKKRNLNPEKTASGLYYIIKDFGNGKAVGDSQQVSINYTSSLLDGKVFDSSLKKKYNHKMPFNFTVGAGQVIKGFDEGTRLVKEGGRVLLLIPSVLGYGDKGVGPIPANSVLLFDIRVEKVLSGPGC